MSNSSYFLPSNSTGTFIASIVVPAKGETITLSFNDKELIRVDLPAFGLPIIEIFGELPSSVSVSYTHLRAHET